jgi:hypothetical protein
VVAPARGPGLLSRRSQVEPRQSSLWLTRRIRESKNASDIAAGLLEFEAYSIHLAFKEIE